MKKKLLALLCALTLALTATACGGGSTGADDGNSEASSVPAVSELAESTETEQNEEETPDGETEEAPDAENETPEDAAAAAPEQTPSKPAGSGGSGAAQGSQSAPAKPSGFGGFGTAQKPENPPADAGSASGSGGSSSENAGTAVDLAKFYTDTAASIPDFPAMMELTGEAVDSFYAGLNALKPKQCVIYTPMISAVACEVAVVEMESEADAKSAAEIFQARVDYQVDQQGAWYPATIEQWENTAKIVTSGKYALLTVGNSADQFVSSFRTLVG